MEPQVILSAATFFAIIGASWKLSSELATMRATMAKAVDVAVLQTQLKNAREDIDALWQANRKP